MSEATLHALGDDYIIEKVEKYLSDPSIGIVNRKLATDVCNIMLSAGLTPEEINIGAVKVALKSNSLVSQLTLHNKIWMASTTLPVLVDTIRSASIADIADDTIASLCNRQKSLLVEINDSVSATTAADAAHTTSNLVYPLSSYRFSHSVDSSKPLIRRSMRNNPEYLTDHALNCLPEEKLTHLVDYFVTLRAGILYLTDCGKVPEVEVIQAVSRLLVDYIIGCLDDEVAEKLYTEKGTGENKRFRLTAELYRVKHSKDGKVELPEKRTYSGFTDALFCNTEYADLFDIDGPAGRSYALLELKTAKELLQYSIDCYRGQGAAGLEAMRQAIESCIKLHPEIDQKAMYERGSICVLSDLVGVAFTIQYYTLGGLLRYGTLSRTFNSKECILFLIFALTATPQQLREYALAHATDEPTDVALVSTTAPTSGNDSKGADSEGGGGDNMGADGGCPGETASLPPGQGGGPAFNTRSSGRTRNIGTAGNLFGDAFLSPPADAPVTATVAAPTPVAEDAFAPSVPAPAVSAPPVEHSDPFAELLAPAAVTPELPPAPVVPVREVKDAAPLTAAQTTQHRLWLSEALSANGGPLYYDGTLYVLLTLESRGSQCRFSFMHINQTSEPITEFKVTVTDSAGLMRFELGELPTSELEGGARLTQIMMAECQHAVAEAPQVTFTYVDATAHRRTATIDLPLIVTSVNEPQALSAGKNRIPSKFQFRENVKSIREVRNDKTGQLSSADMDFTLRRLFADF
eukprot:gene21144-24000_t